MLSGTPNRKGQAPRQKVLTHFFPWGAPCKGSGSTEPPVSFILLVCPAPTRKLRSARVHAQADVSTQPSPPFQDARVSCEDEDQRWTGSLGTPPCQRA